MQQSISVPANSKDDFERFVAQTECYLDDVVIEGSDQELFIASYLSGHFSLVVSRVELQKNWDINHLNQIMLESLSSVFAQNELLEEDQKQVLVLWKKLTDTVECIVTVILQ